MLERFREAKGPEIEALRRAQAQEALPKPFDGKRPGFVQALRAKGRGAVIAEYKRASPSRGDINLGRKPAEVARIYAEAGAAAVSVLTEKTYFKGDLSFLSDMTGPGLPLLRKDFLFDPLQVDETAATPASAMLLIARMFDGDEPLAAMLRRAASFGLTCVTEIFDERDLELARRAGADVIQVNNRDLDTLAVSLDVSRRLAPLRALGELWISASGVSAPAQVAELADLGFDAVLVGTSLMEKADPGQALRALAAGARS